MVSLPLILKFDRPMGGYQFVEKAEWIPSLGVKYLIGIDGISLLMVMLTTLMGFVAMLLFLVRGRGPAQGILRDVPVLQTGMIRRVHFARLLPLLRVLGTGAGSDVLHHRSLGRSQEAVRCHQVLPLHADRQRPDAARVS
ncbi:MAG: hypothetical protein QM757_15900 [Paludibaculum sp.]